MTLCRIRTLAIAPTPVKIKETRIIDFMVKKIKSISDLTPDDHNANKGTQRGVGMLHHSLSTLGAGRSIVCDRNGKVIGGNKTLERAYELGFEIQPVFTQGDKLVVVVREDLDLDNDERARQLAYADNRTSEISLDWDTDQLISDFKEVDLDWLWSEQDLTALLGQFSAEKDAEQKEEQNDSEPYSKEKSKPITLVMDPNLLDRWNQYAQANNMNTPSKIVDQLLKDSGF